MLRIKQHRFIWVGIVVLGVILLGMPAVYAEDWHVRDEAPDEYYEEAASYDTEEMEGDLEVLGDISEDLVYTPVTPCKVVDTRYGGGGFIYAGQTRTYFVHGNVASQGGGYCPSPVGEPSAVHISMTAVNPNGKGNIKAFPKGAAGASGLTVNYNTIGTNLANAGTVKTAYNAGDDIGVKTNFAGAHVTIQVLGYYSRPEATAVQTTTITTVITVSPNSCNEGFSYCPSGYRVTGGGGHFNFISSNLRIGGSSRPFGNGWGCEGCNLTSGTQNFNVHAVCTRIPGR